MASSSATHSSHMCPIKREQRGVEPSAGTQARVHPGEPPPSSPLPRLESGKTGCLLTKCFPQHLCTMCSQLSLSTRVPTVMWKGLGVQEPELG